MLPLGNCDRRSPVIGNLRGVVMPPLPRPRWYSCVLLMFNQAAFAALMEEKHELENRTARFAVAAEETRDELERKIHEAINAARDAETRADSLSAHLEGRRDVERVPLGAAEIAPSDLEDR